MRQLKISTQITNRDSQAVEMYLQEVSKIDMITPEEESRLAIARDEEVEGSPKYQKIIDTLVRANLRFVVSVAKQYQHQGLALSDLISEGNLGLIKAAQRFDHTKGFKFISYAVWWIRQSILQALAEQGRLVRLPQNKIGTYNKVSKASAAFEQEYEREPTDDELAEIMELDEKEISNIRTSNTRHSSLDAPLNEEGDGTMIDLIKAESGEINAVFAFSNQDELSETVQRMMEITSSLTDREKEIMFAYFGFKGLTIEQIGLKYDLTKERIRQIKEKAIRKLQKKKESIKRVVGGDEYNKKQSKELQEYKSGRPYTGFKAPVFTGESVISTTTTLEKKKNKKPYSKPSNGYKKSIRYHTQPKTLIEKEGPKETINKSEIYIRCNTLLKLGLEFNGEAYIKDDINVYLVEVQCDTDKQFEEKITSISLELSRRTNNSIGNIIASTENDVASTLIEEDKQSDIAHEETTTQPLNDERENEAIQTKNKHLETTMIGSVIESVTIDELKPYEEKMNAIMAKNYNWELQLDASELSTNDRRCVRTFIKHYITTKNTAAGKRYTYSEILRDARLRTGIIINQEQFDVCVNGFLDNITDLQGF